MGIVEVVNENRKPLGAVHYILYREVLRQESETTKVRIVYAASLKTVGKVSINDCLESGPKLAPLLFDILLRFQVYNVALIADIEKVFLNIAINSDQHDYLLFLWLKDCHIENPEIITLRLLD